MLKIALCLCVVIVTAQAGNVAGGVPTGAHAGTFGYAGTSRHAGAGIGGYTGVGGHRGLGILRGVGGYKGIGGYGGVGGDVGVGILGGVGGYKGVGGHGVVGGHGGVGGLRGAGGLGGVRRFDGVGGFGGIGGRGGVGGYTGAGGYESGQYIPDARNAVYAQIPFSFEYEAPAIDGSSSRTESGDGAGRVTGSYTINEADGRSRVVNYVADEGGFRAQIETNEPGTLTSNAADAIYRSNAPAVNYSAGPSNYRGAGSYGFGGNAGGYGFDGTTGGYGGATAAGFNKYGAGATAGGFNKHGAGAIAGGFNKYGAGTSYSGGAGKTTSW